MMAVLTERDRLVALHKIVAIHRKKIHDEFDVPRQREMMGQWIANYLDDAGYHLWIAYPELFKAMIMNAFPAKKPLNNTIFDLTTVESYENWLMGFLSTLEQHIRLERDRAHADAFLSSTRLAT